MAMMPRSLGRTIRPIHSMRDAALDLLDGTILALRNGVDDRTVHKARKASKRVRAALRLLRDWERVSMNVKTGRYAM